MHVIFPAAETVESFLADMFSYWVDTNNHVVRDVYSKAHAYALEKCAVADRDHHRYQEAQMRRIVRARRNGRDVAPLPPKGAKTSRFKSRVDAFNQLEPNQQFRVVLRTFAEDLVRASVESAIHERLLWVKMPSEAVDQCLSFHFSNWDIDLRDVAGRDFYNQVVDPLLVRMEGWVQTVIPTPTWTMWSLRTLGKDFYLEDGEDFRIVDWTRRMEEGEWSQDVAPSVEEVAKTDFEEANEFSQQLVKDTIIHRLADMIEKATGYPPRRDVVTKRPVFPADLIVQVEQDVNQDLGSWLALSFYQQRN